MTIMFDAPRCRTRLEIYGIAFSKQTPTGTRFGHLALLHTQDTDPNVQKILDVSVLVFATLATKDPRNANDLATHPRVAETIARYLSMLPAQDPLGFNADQTRPDEARRIGLGKNERSQVRPTHV